MSEHLSAPSGSRHRRYCHCRLRLHFRAMIDDALVTRPLYGGAAQLAFPQRFADISDFRPVPDHQEASGGLFPLQDVPAGTARGARHDSQV